MNTIKEQWDSFSKLIPETAPKVQYQEMRRAFYAGAKAVITIQLSLDDNISDEAGAKILEGIWDELDLFAKQVLAGER